MDAHAHVAPGVPAADLASLGAAVLAVTRSPSEWTKAAGRKDDFAAWGLGCHPGLINEVETFSPDGFSDALVSAPFVGEVGIDGRRGADMTSQSDVFDQVLEMVATYRRAVSIHSMGAAPQVLDALERFPQPGAILHWWRASKSETERAVEMGCFFSLNGAEAMSPRVIDQLPAERVLTETDFPHAQKQDPTGDGPGRVDTIERALQHVWGLDEWGVRQQVWTNLALLLELTQSTGLMPVGIRKALLLLPSPEDRVRSASSSDR